VQNENSAHAGVPNFAVGQSLVNRWFDGVGNWVYNPGNRATIA